MSGTYSDDWDGGLVGNLPDDTATCDRACPEGQHLTDGCECVEDDSSDGYGGLTGDPDTSIAEYGGLIGYVLADGDGDPYFHSSDEQADGEDIVEGGINEDADSSAFDEAFDDIPTPDPTETNYKFWAGVGLFLLALIALRPYASLGAEVAG